jgi:SAM-dependent methyltransferase
MTGGSTVVGASTPSASNRGRFSERPAIWLGCEPLTSVAARAGSLLSLRRPVHSPSPSMLAVAVRRPHSFLALADAVALPFHDAAFDVAFAVRVCEFVDNVGQVFSELARVTRPGGRFVVGSLNPQSPWVSLIASAFAKLPGQMQCSSSLGTPARLGAKDVALLLDRGNQLYQPSLSLDLCTYGDECLKPRNPISAATWE